MMDFANFRIQCKVNFHRLEQKGGSVTFESSEIGTALKRWKVTEDFQPLMKDAGEALLEVLKAKLNDKNMCGETGGMLKSSSKLRKEMISDNCDK